MNTGSVLIPVKDFMSLDPFRLFPNRMERLFEEPMLRTVVGNEEWPLKAWGPSVRHLRDQQGTGDEV